MNNLEDIITLLSDKEKIYKQAVSSEYFSLCNILALIENLYSTSRSIHWGIIENKLIVFYKQICTNAKFTRWSKEIELYINKSTLTENDFLMIKNTLERMKKEEFNSVSSLSITVKILK